MAASDVSSHGSSPVALDAHVAAHFQRAAACLGHEPQKGEFRWQARAAGCLDVMGGISEYAGGTVLRTTVQPGVTVTVQLREDQKVVIYGRSAGADCRSEPMVFDLATFDAQNAPDGVEGLARRLLALEHCWLPPAAGAVYAMFKSKKLEGSEAGVTIFVDSDLPPHADLGCWACVAVPVIMALTDAWALRFDPFECAQLATVVENDIAGFPCGVGAAMATLYGDRNVLTLIDCRGFAEPKAIDIPPSVALVGIHCGVKHRAAREKYVKVRTAAYMGRRLIEAIPPAGNGDAPRWNGWLATLSSDEYVQRWRDRVPTRMRGADFLERFGPATDPLIVVDPQTTYKVRSRTEHHIYEAERAAQFAEKIVRAAEQIGVTLFRDLGELMYASHWSYGQRCGLGSIETDALVNHLRKRSNDGIFGARVSGQGAGGVVVALLENSERARAAMREAVQQYEHRYAVRATIVEGSSPGALHYGVQRG